MEGIAGGTTRCNEPPSIGKILNTHGLNGLGDAREPVAAPVLFTRDGGQVAGAVGVAVCGDVPGCCEGAGEGDEESCKREVLHIEGSVACA